MAMRYGPVIVPVISYAYITSELLVTTEPDLTLNSETPTCRADVLSLEDLAAVNPGRSQQGA